MATLSFERAITGGHLGEGAAIADAMVPFLFAAIVFSYFGLQRRRWQPGSEGLSHGRSGRSRGHGLPRAAASPPLHALSSAGRFHIRAAVSVLLDDDDDLQARRRALRLRPLQSVLDRSSDARAHSQAVSSRRAIRNGWSIRWSSRWRRPPFHCLRAFVRPMRSSGCASLARATSGSPSFSPISFRQASCLFPLATIVFRLGLYDSHWALILTYPTFLVPFCTWLLMGYFRTIPYELEECAMIDGASRTSDPQVDHSAAGRARA